MWVLDPRRVLGPDRVLGPPRVLGPHRVLGPGSPQGPGYRFSGLPLIDLFTVINVMSRVTYFILYTQYNTTFRRH